MNLRQERVLHACQEICRTLAEEALMRIRGDLKPDAGFAVGADRRHWLLDERAKLERLLEALGEPL